MSVKSKQRILLGAIAPFVLLVAFEGLIFCLTEQSAEQTTAASTAVTEAIANSAPVSQDVTDAIAGGYISRDLAVMWDWVRRLAHVAEFFPIGVASAWLVSTFQPLFRNRARRHPLLASLVICVASSLFDQVHKLFVPGREFDCLDLAFDAAGYIVGIASFLGVLAIVMKYAKRD